MEGGRWVAWRTVCGFRRNFSKPAIPSCSQYKQCRWKVERNIWFCSGEQRRENQSQLYFECAECDFDNRITTYPRNKKLWKSPVMQGSYQAPDIISDLSQTLYETNKPENFISFNTHTKTVPSYCYCSDSGLFVPLRFAGGFFSDRLVKCLGFPSRLWLLSTCTLLAAPLATGTLDLVCCSIHDHCGDCSSRGPLQMNLVGGNLPVIVAPLRAYFNEYRSALCLVWPGFLTISAFIFILSSLPLYYRDRKNSKYSVNE